MHDGVAILEAEMKLIGMIIMAVFLLGLVAYTVMAMLSQKMPNTLGLKDGLLVPCPDSPNCVCSESHSKGDVEHAIEGILVTSDSWTRLKQVIQEQGGRIEKEEGDYLHATFSSAIFRYVDDVEFRQDVKEGIIHMRSASRIGRSDFGVNRQRMESIKKAL